MELDSELITKFNNIFIMLHYSIMNNDVARVRHFLVPELYEMYKTKVEENISNKEIHMFDELNVKDTKILERNNLENRYQIVVQLISRYMDYFVDLETGQYKRGISDRRVEKTYILVFEKMKNAVSTPMVSTCPNCGANLDVNYSGVCAYCAQSVNLIDSDYRLVSIEIVS